MSRGDEHVDPKSLIVSTKHVYLLTGSSPATDASSTPLLTATASATASALQSPPYNTHFKWYCSEGNAASGASIHEAVQVLSVTVSVVRPDAGDGQDLQSTMLEFWNEGKSLIAFLQLSPGYQREFFGFQIRSKDNRDDVHCQK